MEPADRMMVRRRAAMLDGRGRARRQHLHELVEHDRLVEEATKREVEAGTVGIDMGEAAGDGTLAAGYLPDGILGDLHDLGVEIAETLPCHRGLERRGKDSARHRVLAVMGRANEFVAPGAGGP